MSPIDEQLIARKAKMIEEDLSKLREFENFLKEEKGILPKDYYESFVKLSESGVLDNELVFSSIRKCLEQIPVYLQKVL